MTNEEIKNITSESLRDWFKKEKWVRISSSGKIAGACGTSKNKKNPDRCLPKAKAQSLTKGQRAATAAKKKKAGKKGKTVVKNTKKATVKKEGFFANLKKQNRINKIKKDIVKAAGGPTPQHIYGAAKKFYLKFKEEGDELGMQVAKKDLDTFKNKIDPKYQINTDEATVKKETKGAPKGHYFTKSGNLVKGTLSKDARERGARLSDPKDKQRSKVPPVTQYSEMKKEDIKNLVVGLLHEMQNTNFKVLTKGPYYRYLPTDDLFTDLDQLGHHGLQRSPDNLVVIKTAEELLDIFDDMHYDDPERALAWADQNDDIIKFIGTNEVLMEKDDRCTRLAKQKYDTWPSAYASGAVVRCRRGEIWKKK